MRVVADGSPLRDKRRASGIGRYVRELGRALVEVPDLTFKLALPPALPSERMIVHYLGAQPWIAAKAAASRADLVHATATNPVIGWPLGRQVVTVHDALLWTTHAPPPASPTGRYLAYQRTRFKRCAAVIVASDVVAEEVVVVFGAPEDRIHIVPLGVDRIFTPEPDPADGPARRLAGAPDGRYILWVGDIRHRDPRKSLDDLIEAVAALGPVAPTLVLAGSKGPEAARLSRLAETKAVALVAPGYVSDGTLAALYRGAVLVAVPSRHEGFGFTVLEAFACGAPVVAAAGGNLRSLAGDAAVVVSPGDVAALTSSFRSILADETVRERLRRAGPVRAAGFTWRRTAERTAEVYRVAAAMGRYHRRG